MQLHDLGFGKPFQAGCFVVEVFKIDAKFGKPTLRNGKITPVGGGNFTGKAEHAAPLLFC
jgi:hypothetical protein